MPTGVTLNALAVLLGGLIGAFLGERLPIRVRKSLPLIFGLVSIAMGLTPVINMNSAPPVVLALIIGSAIGELVRLETLIENGVSKIKGPVEKLFGVKNNGVNSVAENSKDNFMGQFVSIVVLFCVSGMGIFGALTEGMTGDYNMLMAKAVLDFFTAMIFASTLGYLVASIALPQFVILLLLFLGAGFIMPYTTPEMIADFSAVGGVIMIAAGFRISGVKSFPIANMLPAFILVMPLSHLFTVLLG